MPSTYHDLDWPSPINWRHPLNRGLKGWWLGLPERAKGVRWLDLVQQSVGTLTNMSPSADWVAATRPGGSRCLDFDGTDDFVQLSDSPIFDPGGQATWSLWFWTNTAQSGRAVWLHDVASGKSATSFKWIASYVTTNSTVVASYVRVAGTAYSTSTTTTLIGRWTHLVTTFDRSLGSARLKTYLNGVLTNSADAADGDIDAGADPEVGRWEGNPSVPYFTGRIDDLQLWHRALSAAEAAQLYRESQAGYPNMLRRRRPVAKAGAAAGISRRDLLLLGCGA